MEFSWSHYRNGGKRFPYGQGRVTGGSADDEAAYLRQLLASGMADAEASRTAAKALPKPIRTIVGRLLLKASELRRRIVEFSVGLATYALWRMPDRARKRYFTSRLSLKETLRRAIIDTPGAEKSLADEQSGVASPYLGDGAPLWPNPFDLRTKEERDARKASPEIKVRSSEFHGALYATPAQIAAKFPEIKYNPPPEERSEWNGCHIA